jgi:CDGSH-type Zn-finger protein
MTRLVELDATGPRKLEESDLDPEKGDVAVCQCGLSDRFPFCDGTHGSTEDERDDARYRYVEESGKLRRREIDRVVYLDEGTDPDDGSPRGDR